MEPSRRGTAEARTGDEKADIFSLRNAWDGIKKKREIGQAVSKLFYYCCSSI